MTYTTVVFDWDGTVMDSTWSIVSSIQSAARVMGLPVPSAQKASWVIGLSIGEALTTVVPELKLEQLPEFVDQYKRFYFTQDHELKLFDGMLPLLEHLKAEGILLAVATGKSRIGLDHVLSNNNLGRFFEVTKTADQTRGKPDPLMLEEIMQELMVSPQEVVMVGDTSHDINMARNAGCDSIAVLYGAQSASEIAASKPMRMVNTVEELRRLLDIYCAKKP